MSQNRELEFVEIEAGKWFYLLEDRMAPKDSWDWREFATGYGPFATYEEAQHHQYDLSSISTPGHTVTPLEHFTMTPAIAALVKDATLERAW